MRKKRFKLLTIILSLIFCVISFCVVLVAFIRYVPPALWVVRFLIIEEREKVRYGRLCYYDEDWLEGKTRAEIEEKYGEFEKHWIDKNGTSCGWPIYNENGERVPYAGSTECYYYMVLFDKDGIAFDTDVMCLTVPGG